MPVHSGKDGEGCFMQWGNSGKKYHYECGNGKAKSAAKRKAELQGVAAYSHGYKGKK